MNNDDQILRKIEKLLAVANNTSASEEEVLSYTAKATQLMQKYKIEEYRLLGHKDVEVVVDDFTFPYYSTGYLTYVNTVIAKECRCIGFYKGKINSVVYLGAYGIKEDLEIYRSMLAPLLKYIEVKLKMYKKRANYKSFSVWKREYISGFAESLRNHFNENKIDLNNEYSKNELICLDIPAKVKDVANNNVTIKKSFYTARDIDGYLKGIQDGESYDFETNYLD